ncbi:MMPL family transporter [Paenibacillus sp. KQZ6P-2]|uniref:MMPL family transporter n=1 Tax=Paenibacillus mangrovi TaxID=2931978 RepID=A0A9X1WP02_9BACL|nr:MMPL family transporter [Paenibacillus mangrovi]MCJ8012413.1 MMPL family transporter [Paenibacillus mangrovi]
MGFRLLAYLIHRHPGAIVACWAVFFIFFGSFSTQLPSSVHGPGLDVDGSARRVQQILNERLGIPVDPIYVVFERHADTTAAGFRTEIDIVLNKIRKFDGVALVISPLEHQELIRDGTAYAVLDLKEPSYQQASLITQIRGLTSKVKGTAVQLTGKSVIQEDVNRASMHDFKVAERIGVPVAFMILLFAFGGFWYAFIPVLTGLLTVSSAMGMMVLVSRSYDLELSNFILNVIPMTGLALSLDFAFILTSRFREELRTGSAPRALRSVMTTSGRAVFYSSVCVLCGLKAVSFIPMPMFSSAAISSMVVVVLAAAINLMLVPAVLMLLAPLLKNKARLSLIPNPSYRLWSSWADLVMHRPLRTLFTAVFLLLLLLIPAFQLRTSVPDAASLPVDMESRHADEVIRTHFAQKGTEVLVVLQPAGEVFTVKEREIAYSWLDVLQKDPMVIDLKPLQMKSTTAELSSKIAVYQVLLNGEPGSARVNEWLRAAEVQADASGMHILLGGEAKSQQEVKDAIARSLPQMLGFIMVSNLLVLLIAFRSLLIPLKALVMNVLSITASLGVLVIIFQTGITGQPPVDIAIMVPVFIFGLVFGVSMDYGVFLISRMSEAFEDTRDPEHAIRHGLAATGKLITSAAAILIAVTLPFVFGAVEGVRQLGFGIAAAVFIDVTLIRLLIVPSLMKLLGHLNWWVPRWLRSSR